MKKRKCEIILGIMLLLALASGSAMANPVVDIGAAAGPACNQVVVPITLTNDGIVSVAGVGVDIGYNSQYLTPISAVVGPAGQAAGKSIAQNIVSPGLYRVLIFSTSNTNTIGNGIIANVTFAIDCAAPATTYMLGNTPSSSTAGGASLPTDGSDGSILVGQANTTTTTAAVRPPEEHMVSCNVCHLATIHNYPTHTNSCANCHIPGDDTTPQPPQCIVCHPQGNTGTCNLVNFHDPAKSTPCLSCHVDCNADTSDDHIKQCLVCHPTDFSSTSSLRIHSRPGHSTCEQCHDGTPAQGNVTADKCAGCHPLGDTGQCKLVDLHSPNIISTCLTCHMNCAGGAPTSTTTTATGSTTTTIGGGSTTIPTTTTSAPQDHFDICLTCHYSIDLHAEASHNVCSTCHNGSPGKGNVNANNCIVCHPTGNPGECNLVVLHGQTCTSCHSNPICPPASTTTTVSDGSHTDLCLSCHYLKDVHARPEHSVCSSCHTGTPAMGNVSSNACVSCHAPKCTLANFHGNTCTNCHFECIPVTTSTTTTANATTSTTSNTTSVSTTTTAPPGTCQIIDIKPVNGVKIGFGLIPRIAKISVTTNVDLKSFGIIDCDFKFENNPRGIYVLGARITGSTIAATVLFVAVQPGDYTILLGDCGSTSITLTRFWREL